MFDTYDEIEKYFDALNTDESHFANRNDICTPIVCVKEMVDSVPDELWAREDLCILDPCCGNGNFPAYIATKTSLDNIRFNEISDARIANLKEYFGEEIALSQLDFLEYPDGERFDLIVANPPYAKFMEDGKRASKNHNMSRAFIEKALSLTKDNGYILFIVPDNWMTFADRNHLPEQMTQYTLLALDIHGPKRYFPRVGSSFTWFLLQKTPNTGQSAVIYNHYHLKDTQYASFEPGSHFIPLYYSDTVRSIIAKTINANVEKYAVETTSYLHKYTKRKHIVNEPDDTHPYRLIHTPSQTVYSDIPHKYQGGWKVFIPTTNQYKPFIDCDCGMTQSIAFIRCNSEEEARRICDELSQPVYQFLNNITRYGNFNNNRILERLPLWGTFELDDDELDTIEKFNAAYPATFEAPPLNEK